MMYRALLILPLAALFAGCAAAVKKPEPIEEPALCQGSATQRNLTVIWSKRHYWCGNQALPVFTEVKKEKMENTASDAPRSKRKGSRIKPSRSKISHRPHSTHKKPTQDSADTEPPRKTIQRPVERTEGAPLASASSVPTASLNAPPIAPDARLKMAPTQGASLIQEQALSVSAKTQDPTPPASDNATVFKSEDDENPIFVAPADNAPRSVITFAPGARTVGPGGRKKLASLIGSLDASKPVWVVGHAGGQQDLENLDAIVVATQRAESVRNHLLELGIKTPVEIKAPSQIQAGRYVKVGQE